MDATRREELFRTWSHEHLGILLKVARAFAPSAADRDELLQDLLSTLWEALPAFRAGSKASTFIYRVAHNRALNWQRGRTRYWRRIQPLEELPDAELPGPPEDDSREQLALLYEAIHALAPLDRTLVLLSLDGLPYSEIAEVTGLTENHIGVRLTRARQRLKDTLSQRRQ
ncbi:RNA polymerase sigma factor [Hyalangium versicolor]|uniref:RNA polymerase sigma factor n=1 Tax=Hyalangium versicolor TaxID=2861190 RepID=UPI001CCADF3E|nr:sigma-70 family RNA polymerase sigma factor [Hyalangium versicolor]